MANVKTSFKLVKFISSLLFKTLSGVTDHLLRLLEILLWNKHSSPPFLENVEPVVGRVMKRFDQVWNPGFVQGLRNLSPSNRVSTIPAFTHRSMATPRSFSPVPRHSGERGLSVQFAQLIFEMPDGIVDAIHLSPFLLSFVGGFQSVSKSPSILW